MAIGFIVKINKWWNIRKCTTGLQDTGRLKGAAQLLALWVTLMNAGWLKYWRIKETGDGFGSNGVKEYIRRMLKRV
jgi:hypothetical protein